MAQDEKPWDYLGEFLWGAFKYGGWGGILAAIIILCLA